MAFKGYSVMQLCIIFVSILLGNAAALTSHRRESTGNCGICLHSSIGLLNDVFMSDTAADAMGMFMDEHLCPKAQDTNQCRATSRILVPLFFRWFRASASPAKLCSAPRVCGLGANEGYLSRPLQRQPSNGPLCALCAFVIKEMKGALNSTNVQDTIMEKAKEVCNSLPKDIGASCVDFVTTYEPLVTQFIEAVDAGELCMLIGACMDGLVASRVPPALPMGLVAALAKAHDALATVPSNDACDICKMAELEAHSLVTNPTVQADLVNYTKSLCDMMAGSLTATCHEYVDTYSVQVFDLMDKFLSGDKLCAQLGICKPPSFLLLGERIKETVAKFSHFGRESLTSRRH